MDDSELDDFWLAYTQGEAERVRKGPQSEEQPAGWLWTFPIRCPGNASEVLARVREALGVVLRYTDQDWPDDPAWSYLLPDWFVAKCARETAKEDQIWRGLSEQERHVLLRDMRAERWSALNWVYSFRPDGERFWFWWDAEVIDANTLHITLQNHESIYASGNFRFLLWAAGAIAIGQEY